MYYTKYRPQKFSEISKPSDTAQALMRQVSTGKTAHAYLFVGSRGTGKTTTARLLAKALNCLDLQKKGPDAGDPCAKCENCLKIQSGTFLDLIEIDAASNRGIDDIRDLREKIKLSPSVGKSKTYIIDEVHMLTSEAFNALLKTLEEPPSHAVFILCTTEFHKVPDTIKSRCQVYKFKRATTNQLVEKLAQIAKNEGAKVKKEELEKIASASFGGFRDAETMLQQVIEGNLDVESLVGLSSQDIYIDFVQHILDKDLEAALKQVNKLVEDGYDLNVWVLDLLNYLRDLLFINTNVHEGLIETVEENLKRMKVQASSISNGSIVGIIEEFIKAGNELNNSPIPQLPIELSIIRIINPDQGGVKQGFEQKNTSPGSSDSGKSSKTARQPDEIDAPDDPDEDDVDLRELAKKDKQTSREKAAADLAAPEEISVNISVDDVKKSWKKILNSTIVHNNSIYALLKSAKPCEIEGANLTIEVSYAFHKERLETPRNRKIVEGVIKEILEVPLNLNCKVSEKKPSKKEEKEVGELTDQNIIPVYSSNLNEIFDGGLPL
jgi:DNA polymerase III subunit gamma/tau